MAFVLTVDNQTSGLGNQVAGLLLSYKRFHTLTPPVTITDMRNELEAGQLPGYISDSDWNQFLVDMASVSLDTASLVASERAIINTIRQEVTPEPQQACCGSVIPADLDGLISIAGFYRVGTTAPYQYEVALTLDKSLSCDIKNINVTLVGAPAPTSANPFKAAFKECNSNGDSVFSFLWVEWAANPATNSYDLTYDFLDENGLSITTFAVTDYQLNL